MAHLLPNVRQQFLDSNGVPVAGGSLYSYAAGTSTPLATYPSQDEGAANANPLVLDANGIGDVWLGASAYKLVLKDSGGSTLWTRDNVSHITAGAVTTAKIADLGVTTAKLAANVLANSTTGRTKMEDGFLSADSAGRLKMADGFLSADSAGRLKMADGYVTPVKRAALGENISSGVIFSTSGTGIQDVTGATVTITTTGRPVFIGFMHDPATAVNTGNFACNGTACIFSINEGATTFASLNMAAASMSIVPASSFSVIKTGLTAGSHTFKLTAIALVDGTADVNAVKMYAFEL